MCYTCRNSICAVFFRHVFFCAVKKKSQLFVREIVILAFVHKVSFLMKEKMLIS